MYIVFREKIKIEKKWTKSIEFLLIVVGKDKSRERERRH